MSNINDKIAERAARGEYDLIEPLDYMILDKLPNEGTTMAGYYQVGETVSSLVKQFNLLKSTTISTRIRVMALMGLVVGVKLVGSGGKMAWQRTPKAVEILDKWKESHG